MNKILPRELFGKLVGETHRLWRLRMNERLRPLGLSQSRWTTLRELSRAGDAIPQTQLAARVGIEAPTLVGILDGLVRSGFVARRVSPGDRRIRTIHLTAKAQRKLEQIEQVAHELRLEGTRNIDADTLAAAIAALERVKMQLLAMTPSARPAPSKAARRRPARPPGLAEVARTARQVRQPV
jgi:MarR family transcriptional regulator for hemolysin